MMRSGWSRISSQGIRQNFVRFARHPGAVLLLHRRGGEGAKTIAGRPGRAFQRFPVLSHCARDGSLSRRSDLPGHHPQSRPAAGPISFSSNNTARKVMAGENFASHRENCFASGNHRRTEDSRGRRATWQSSISQTAHDDGYIRNHR